MQTIFWIYRKIHFYITEKKRIDSTLRDYFPQNIDTLRTIGCDVSEKVKFVEMTSSGLRFQETRGVYPVFVLPVLHGTLLKPLLRNVLYPVFCAVLVESDISVTDISKDLLQVSEWKFETLMNYALLLMGVRYVNLLTAP